MGIVSEAYHKGVPLLGSLESPLTIEVTLIESPLACVSFLKSHFTNMTMDNHQEKYIFKMAGLEPLFSLEPMANLKKLLGITYNFYFMVPNG